MEWTWNPGTGPSWKGDNPSQPKRGQACQLVERTEERKRPKKEIQSLIDSIGTLIRLDKNLELMNQESLKPNECFKQFGDLHEKIQELLVEEEQETDSKVYQNLHIEIFLFT